MLVLLLVLMALMGADVESGSTPNDAGDTVGAWIWTDGEPAGAAWLDAKGVTTHHLNHLQMVTFYAAEDVANELVRRHGGKVWPNEHFELHLDQSVRYIEADVVQRAVGTVRTGPTVLVVDTGVDSLHPDFQDGNLAANVQAVRQGGLVVGSLDQAPVVDTVGHGTHVAGIVSGTGDATGPRDPSYKRFEGVYANGRVASYQASNDPETGEPSVDTLAALEAFDWALENRDRFDIRVVTNSWGHSGTVDVDHPINEASLRLYTNGLTVVFSAGNQGDPGTLNRHCVLPWVICVAAGDLDNRRASFSSQGHEDQTRPYDHPDITAPGLFIKAANPVASSDILDLSATNLYVDRSGTSMAAPHVAGAAALIQAANPDLSPDQVMDILIATASPMADDIHRVGAGYLDAREAYNLATGTVGNRAAFLAGQEVKYAGEASGDAGLANDPLSVGFDSTVRPSPLRLPAQEDIFVTTPLALILLGAALVAALGGTRLRG